METATRSAPALRLKASLHPFTQLELDTLDVQSIQAELEARLQKAPQLLKHAPVVIKFPHGDIKHHEAHAIISMLRALDFIPVGIRLEKNQDNDGVSLAEHLNLPIFNDSPKSKKANKEPNPNSSVQNNTQLIHQAVRSGQQVVNPNGDLVILGNVGQGAEVLAAGSIHIHGTLSGRALAGIQGNKSATISCQKLQAELVSVAGQFIISEDLDQAHWQKTCFIEMQEDRLILHSA